MTNQIKMSKSLGNVVTLEDIKKSLEYIDIWPDILRFFFMKDGPIVDDKCYSEDLMISTYNTFLRNKYGNLVQRVLTFIQKHCEKKIPMPTELTEEDDLLIQEIDLIPLECDKAAEDFNMSTYLDFIFSRIDKCNEYIDKQKPWSLKNTNQERMKTILYVLFESIRKVTIYLQCCLPITTNQILRLLGYKIAPESFVYHHEFGSPLQSNVVLSEPYIIFKPLKEKENE